MANGQQLAEINANTFFTWVAGKSDDDFRAMASRGVLSRNEVARECGFSKSALAQNPRIKATLHKLEADLRARGVLPPIAEPSGSAAIPIREQGNLQENLDSERLKRLERENASLRAETEVLKSQLSKFTLLRDALSMTGRLPR